MNEYVFDNIAISQNKSAESKKPYVSAYTLNYSIYTKFNNKVIYNRKNQKNDCLLGVYIRIN